MAVTAPPGRWEAFLQDLRQALTGRYEVILGETYAPVLASLLFGGHYEDLPPGLLESFSTTGLIHILSVSGSHVALLLAVIQLMGRALGLRPRSLFCISVTFLFLYGALADFFVACRPGVPHGGRQCLQSDGAARIPGRSCPGPGYGRDAALQPIPLF